MKFSYSFSLTPTAPPPAAEKLVPYDYNEFTLSLPDDWSQVSPSEEGALNWYSERLKAGITVSVDFYEVPEEKWAVLAEKCLSARHDALVHAFPDSVDVLSRSAKPYSGGGGLELSYAAHTPECTYLYLGYVTGRKVFNFALTCSADKAAAIHLYNKTLQERLRVKVP